MGGGSSQPAPPSPPPPLLDKPWREINWGDKQEALKYVNDYKPHIKKKQLRILLHGPVGAGKSSFINSVDSVLRGRTCTGALVENTSGDCFTKEYTTYRIQKGNPETFYPFVFNDMMGLDPHKAVLVDDVKLALEGHIKSGYVFNPVCKLSVENKFYNKAPTDNDRVHVLVCVFPADTIPTMSTDTVKKIRDIRQEASRLNIPQVAVLTKADMACPEVKKDLRNIYRSKYLREKMNQFSADVGIPLNCIFLVKNYHEEIDVNDDTDALILNTLKNIINFGEDYVNVKPRNDQTGSYHLCICC